ncbi:hypothetical protein AB0M86_47855 [Streptomyces sp. NPDC051639]|uniref:hypothetical protein n=1 Tax=Streptomyces sp. NPDC051639 TaxID=3155671 RepID=UPI00343E2F66
MKQSLGPAHFEGRAWPGWHHHVTLVSVAHAFCTLQRLCRSPKRDGAGLSLTESSKPYYALGSSPAAQRCPAALGCWDQPVNEEAC